MKLKFQLLLLLLAIVFVACKTHAQTQTSVNEQLEEQQFFNNDEEQHQLLEISETAVDRSTAAPAVSTHRLSKGVWRHSASLVAESSSSSSSSSSESESLRPRFRQTISSSSSSSSTSEAERKRKNKKNKKKKNKKNKKKKQVPDLELSTTAQESHYATLEPWTTWKGSKKYCAEMGYRLCTFQDLCPSGENSNPVAFEELPDYKIVYSPVTNKKKTAKNRYVKLTGKNSCSIINNPEWGPKEESLPSDQTKSVVACCTTKKQQKKGAEAGIVKAVLISDREADRFEKNVKARKNKKAKVNKLKNNEDREIGRGKFGHPITAMRRAFTLGTGGWSYNHHPRLVADVDGDGLGDIVGFADNGVHVSIGLGNGKFAPPSHVYSDFGRVSGGWESQDAYPRFLADVSLDGKADIVGFAHACVFVSKAKGKGRFSHGKCALNAFSPKKGGWSSQDRYPRFVADVNGDGRPDIVGFGEAAVYVSLNQGNGEFSAPKAWTNEFTRQGGGWSSFNSYPRLLADVNGDGKADIVGFGHHGVVVALSTGDKFKAGKGVLANFGIAAGGWSNYNTFPRAVADVNGDGKADIIGFASDGVYVAEGRMDGSFRKPRRVLDDYGTRQTWASFDSYPRILGDLNKDGKADIVAFAHGPVLVNFALPRGE